MRGNLVESLIGAVVLAVAGLFLAFAYTTAGVRSSVGGYDLTARFDRVDGLAIGSDVRMSGIRIGTVVDQFLDPESYVAVVRFNVDSSIRLPEDSSAKVASESLLGGNYLSIEPGGSDVLLQSGGQIKFTQGSVNLFDLIGKAMFGGGNGAGTGAATPKAE